MNQIDIEKWTKERRKTQKREERKRKARAVKDKVVRFAEENPTYAIGAGLGLISATLGIGRSIVKHANLHREAYLRDHYCYDRSLGHYWQLRRKLTNNEWVEIEQRRKAGERLADILASLKVLK